MSSDHFEKELNALLNFVTLEGKSVSPAREEEAGLTLGCRESMIESRKLVFYIRHRAAVTMFLILGLAIRFCNRSSSPL